MVETKKIFLAGGGTGGSATPLIAIAERLFQAGRSTRIEFFWFGSKAGPEKDLVENLNGSFSFKIKYHSLANGKFRRYFSTRNFIDIFKIAIGFVQSSYFILKYRPDIIISAGSYISVPLAWAGWLGRVPVLIHQQDFRAGLANKLMAPFSRTITVTFPDSLENYAGKAVLTGNLVRQEFIDYKIDRLTARQKIGLNNIRPVIFVIGGGTGAEYINSLIRDNLPELSKFCQIVHVTGKNKTGRQIINQLNYHQFEFLHIDGLIKSYTAADIVITRCGMGVLSELSYLAKAAIVIPLPDSHQEDNATALAENKAAIILNQKELSNEIFVQTVRQLLNDPDRQEQLGKNLKKTIKIDLDGEAIKIISEILEII